MSLYSHNYALLPRPSRGAFSFGNDETRARLPDYAKVADLSQFVHRLVYLDLRSYVPSVFVQIKVGAAFICALIVLVLAIFGRRMYEKSFWLFRLLKRPSGTVIVPNSFLAFSLIEGTFGIILVAFLFENCNWYNSNSHRPINFPLWLLLPWCVLIWGAIWAAWGSYFATPGHDIGTRNFSFRHMWTHATVVNALGLAIPLLILVTILVPAAVAAHLFNKGVRLEQQWQETYAQQSSFTEAMIQDAQAVWYTLLRSHYIVSAVFSVWVVFASAMTLSYTAIAWRLSQSVKRELTRTSLIERRNEAAAFASMPFVRDPHQHPSRQDNGTIPNPTREARSKDEHCEDAMDRLYSTMSRNETGVSFDGSIADSMPYPDTTPRHSEPLWRSRLQLPNLIHDPSRPSDAQVAMPAPTQSDRLKELRKAYIHILIHLCAISPACAIFATVAALQMAFTYSGLEQPRGLYGNEYEKWLAIALIMVTWTSCFFGAITLLAIAQRAYEPLFTNMTSQAEASGTARSDAPPSLRRKLSSGPRGILSRLRSEARIETYDIRNTLQSTFFESSSKPQVEIHVRTQELDCTAPHGDPFVAPLDTLVIHDIAEETVPAVPLSPRRLHRARMPSDTIVLQALKPSSSTGHSSAWRSPSTSMSSPKPVHSVHADTTSDSEEEREYFAVGHTGRSRRQRRGSAQARVHL